MLIDTDKLKVSLGHYYEAAQDELANRTPVKERAEDYFYVKVQRLLQEECRERFMLINQLEQLVNQVANIQLGEAQAARHKVSLREVLFHIIKKGGDK